LLNDSAWPGNVRELKGIIQRIVALSVPGPISDDALRPFLSDQTRDAGEEEPIGELDEMERRRILRVLQETGGNKTKAAEILGIQWRTLYKKLARSEREHGTPTEGNS
jgi:DNA-binding NtrC family response regulator